MEKSEKRARVWSEWNQKNGKEFSLEVERNGDYARRESGQELNI